MFYDKILCKFDTKKDESKCLRIFRPWDCEDNSQDCTVSTTTQEEEDETLCENKKDLITTKMCSKSNVTTEIKSSPLIPPQSNQDIHDQKPQLNHDIFVQTTSYSTDLLQDPYNQIYPDLIQNNLAQHLGLSPSDPLLLESLTQGYAFEEYARVLNQEQQAKFLAAKKQRPKKYKCPHCNVGFSNNGQLKGHVRIHTGERPYKCDEKDCNKTFTRNEELTRHKRIHSGLRPFPCSHCGKRFGRKDHLKKHSRTHFQPRGMYAVPVMLPFEAWASGQASSYPFFPMIY